MRGFFKLIVPDRAFRRLSDIEIDEMLAEGFLLVLLDIDGTVVNRLLRRAPADTFNWVESCLEGGMSVCFVTNDRRNRHGHLAEALGVPLYAAAGKPSPEALLRASTETGVPPNEVVMIGNNPFTDVLAARRAGVSAWLVRSLESTRRKKCRGQERKRWRRCR